MKNLLTTVFAILSVIAFGQTPNYASYNWQRGQTFQDTVRFNDTIFTANDGNSTQWDSAYSQVQNNYLNWDGAYNDKINSASFNTGDGVLTLTQQDAGTVTADLDGRYLTSYTETDPIFTASTAFGISDADTTNWDSAYSQVQNNYQNWDSAYSQVQNNYLNWDSAYTAANQAVTTLQDFNPNSQPIADQFFARARDSVASASGYLEYYNQVNSDISRLMNLELSSGRTAYQDATIVFSPAAAYTSATPVIQPYDGSADFTFARSSTATRVDWKGIIESGIAANLARYDFTEDSQEPALLLEPSRTNLFLNSDVLVTQGVTTSATAYTVSFYGTGTITFTGAYSGSLVGTGVNDRVETTFTPTAGTVTCTVTGSVLFAQFEAGSYETSYIPTAGATVTRAAETLSKTGIADLLGDSEGTLYFEGLKFDVGATSMFISLSDGTLNNRVAFGQNTSQTSIVLSITVGGVSQVLVSGGSWVDGQSIKIAIKYSANDFALWVNGVEVATDNSGSTFGAGVLTQIQFNAGNGSIVPFYGNVKALAVWDVALTDAELASLTTP